MHTIVESVKGPQLDWERACGPVDGPWLRAEFEHISSDLEHIERIRVARLDDEIEMTRYREQVATGSHTRGDWEVQAARESARRWVAPGATTIEMRAPSPPPSGERMRADVGPREIGEYSCTL